MENFSVVIQAGGQSKRMGSDKGLLPFGEVTLIEYIFGQVEGFGSEQIIISNKPDDYARFGLPVYGDVFPGRGALGGIYSAISHAKNDHILLLACDMPFVNIKLVNYLIERAPDHDVVIPFWKEAGFAEPFRAVYSKNCLPAIKASLDEEKRRVISFFDQVDVGYVSSEVIHQFDPEERSFFNVNTPEDLAQALILAKY
ncbi:MAG: molybdenum cofactor guanylyltransferase [Chloroflexota bacterium]